MVALRSLDLEPRWMQEPEALWERRALAHDARMEQIEVEKERPDRGTNDPASDSD